MPLTMDPDQDSDQDQDPDADPDPAIFLVIDLQDDNKKLIKKKVFCLLLFRGKVTSFPKIKSQTKVTKQ
jgi:hypothetical protein